MSLLVTHSCGLPPPFPIRRGNATWMRQRVDSIRSVGTQPVSCQQDVASWRRSCEIPCHSSFETLPYQVDLAAPVPRSLGLSYVNLGELHFQRAPERDKPFALKRFDDEIASRLQPSLGKFQRKL